MTDPIKFGTIRRIASGRWLSLGRGPSYWGSVAILKKKHHQTKQKEGKAKKKSQTSQKETIFDMAAKADIRKTSTGGTLHWDLTLEDGKWVPLLCLSDAYCSSKWHPTVSLPCMHPALACDTS
jgi:hypothetical protein